MPYFHLVFTLPHDLNGLIGSNPRLLYETLFGAVSATLTEFAANPRWLGGTAAFTLVLHTWKQDLGRHVHIHALMTGGALSAAGVAGFHMAAQGGGAAGENGAPDLRLGSGQRMVFEISRAVTAQHLGQSQTRASGDHGDA